MNKMSINLEDYIGKTVEVELRNGIVITGRKVLKDLMCSADIKYKYSIASYLYLYSQDGMNDSNGNYDIIKIKELKETEMTINLEDYIGKNVEVELRNDNVITGHKVIVNRNASHHKYRYSIGPYLHYFNQEGMTLTNGDYDIIKIKELKEISTEPETMTNVIRSKIDVFTAYGERVELTVDDDGVFLTHCEDGGVRENLSIGSKDLAIAVAKAILEAYS